VSINIYTTVGVAIESAEKGSNGCIIVAIDPAGSLNKDGRLAIGDYIVAINNESLRHVTTSQAHAIMHRTSLVRTQLRYDRGYCLCLFSLSALLAYYIFLNTIQYNTIIIHISPWSSHIRDGNACAVLNVHFSHIYAA